ncbi:MAG: hypothetical protein ACO1RX_05390 [Candidatus Sericytochromatia bacterium]
MTKYLLGLAASLFAMTPAFAAVQLEPLPQAQQQPGDYQALTQNQGRISVALRHVNDAGQTQVFHPNGSGRLSDTFSPFAYKNIVNTQVFLLTIQNNEGRSLPADQLKVQVSFNGIPYDYLDRNALIRQWRHYYYLNTNTITGAPDFMEQERAIAAENFIAKHAFQPQDVPPGGQLSGFLAVPALEQNGLLKVRIRNLGEGIPQDFVFQFNANQT